jgi:chromosome segregation ATPase
VIALLLQHASQVVSDLSASRADDAALRQQLERHVTEIRQLREQSHAKDAEKRKLQDERNDILRGVANLQADLNRVRQEVITLGLEIAAVRKERDDLSKRNKGDDDELVRAAHQLALAEAKIKELQSGLSGQSAT